MLTTVLDLAGFAGLAIAALILFGIGVALAVASVCVLFVSWKLA